MKPTSIGKSSFLLPNDVLTNLYKHGLLQAGKQHRPPRVI
jgi:hypothetical protein